MTVVFSAQEILLNHLKSSYYYLPLSTRQVAYNVYRYRFLCDCMLSWRRGMFAVYCIWTARLADSAFSLQVSSLVPIASIGLVLTEEFPSPSMSTFPFMKDTVDANEARRKPLHAEEKGSSKALPEGQRRLRKRHT